MILVDTSVWVDHFRSENPRLASLLEDEQVLCHPFVIGELACGNLRNRDQILRLLAALPGTRLAGHDEVLHFIDSRRLYGQGLGWVDVHLLASAMISGCAVWTFDRPLQKAAETLKIAAPPA